MIGDAQITRVLILGGTTEATQLCELMAACPRIAGTLSLAGRTAKPAPQPLPMRIGGFGGAEGLERFLTEQKIDILVDATHPFAEQISIHAKAAASSANVFLIVLTRPAWTKAAGDHWIEVDDLTEVANALGKIARRVLVTSGRQGLRAFESAPQHDYVIRTIEPPEALNLPRAKFLLDRGPFSESAEEALMLAEKIEVLVTKNSGGSATYGKIAAARRLGLSVVMVRPPLRSDALTVHDPMDALKAIEAHHGGTGMDRGV
ncbi:MAG: cobalt-precorrin-6A reductase [Alphaproteobacteria bacterium]|nr:cobalt-precorrin-6A reductase [Alphaproteobacteria bacterium]